MAPKIFFATTLSLVSAASLSAQAPGALSNVSMEQSAVAGAVDNMTQNALFMLLGAIVLASLVFICCVYKSCLGLKQPQANTRRAFLFLLICTVGLSTLGSSCTAAQQARADDIRAAQAAGNSTCPMNQHHNDQTNVASNNHSLYAGYSNWYGPAFCKRCGQRIVNARH